MTKAKPNRPEIKVGYRVGKLTVEAPTPDRKNGYTVWRCRCDCGNEILLDTRYLQRGTVRDCGCETKVKPGCRDITGLRFGKLIAEYPVEGGKRGRTLWHCRCDCGGEVIAPLQQLTAGYRKSCGCMSHPSIKNYKGKRFGMLTVLNYAGKWDGLHHWQCRCDCGKETVVGQTALQSGHTTSCGCQNRPPVEDITGQVFGRLTVLRQEEWKNGTSFWRCRCECGKETVVRYAYLLSGHTKSCGCLQAEIVYANMKFVDGTSVTALEKAGDRLIASNTSGHNGVYWSKTNSKWVAQITFKNKTYYLGSFTKIEDAVKERKKAEERIYGEFLEWYYETHRGKNHTRASNNPPSPKEELQEGGQAFEKAL